MQKYSRFLALFLCILMTACGRHGADSAAGNASSTGSAQEEFDRSGEDTVEREGVVTDGHGWYLWDENGKIDRDNRDGTGKNAAVAANKVEASQAGIDILQKGGNAVDAAIAVGFVLGVVEPNSSGIGGGGFMIIHTADGENHFLNYRETAPAAASPEMWAKDAQGNVIGDEKAYGGKSVGVPGTVMGMEYAYKKYASGNLSWEELIEPAVQLADQGFIVAPQLDLMMRNSRGFMQKYPEFGEVYLKESGENYRQGESFDNKDLARTLRMIQEGGSEAFYSGPIAEKMVETVRKYGGLLTMEDLASYKVREQKPVRGSYRGCTILSSPLPSSGGTHVIEALNIMENFDLSSYPYDSPEHLQILTETFRRIYHDREEFMGDPAYADVPQSGLLSKERARVLAGQIRPGTPSQYEQISPWQYEHEDTTNYAVADHEGNMVCVTQTINRDFGSQLLVGGYGFLLNDEMDDFSPDPDSPNAVAGGKVPLSSMSPTIVLDPDGKPFLAAGSPGAVRIISCVIQILSNMIDYHMGIEEAMMAPRLHTVSTGPVYYEPRFDEATIAKMTEAGYEMEAKDESGGEGFDHFFGGATGVQYGEDGTLTGVSDMRRDGKAVGY